MIALLAGVFILFRNPDGLVTDSGAIKFGKTISLAVSDDPSDGDAMTVNAPDSQLNGLTLKVPSGAYEQEISFEFRETAIVSHELGELFKPITPLITIENGHEFAAQPMMLTIPITKTDDEFAMGFYYDRSSGTLEGIPFTELTNNSITLLTSHFSEIIVSKVKTDRIMDDVDTGFRPGTDDIQSPNIGSILEPKGHCAGQTFANIVYYRNHKAGRVGWEAPLSYRFDNVTPDKTMTFFWDDALAIRLSSAVHRHHAWFWSTPSPLTQQYKEAIADDDRNTFYSFAYSMALSGQPQMMYIKGIQPGTTATSAHAILAYGIAGKSILVCDPNFPGSERTVPFDFGKTDSSGNPDGAFGTYYSGSDATSAADHAVPYQWYGYFGTSALVDVGTVTRLWLDTMETAGKDLVSPLFPQDNALTIAAGRDMQNQLISMPLTDGMRLPSSALSVGGKVGQLLVAPDIDVPGLKHWFYFGTNSVRVIDKIGVDIDQWAVIDAAPGVIDLGVLTMKETEPGKYRYINFRRFGITVGDAAVTVTPETAAISAGEIVNFTAALEGTVNKPLYVWDFNDGSEILQGNLPELPHLYEKVGSFTGTVSVREEENPSVVIGDASFTIDVGAPVSSTTPDGGNDSPLGSWSVSYRFESECQHSGGISAIGHGLRFGAIDGGEQTAYMHVPFIMEVALSSTNTTDNGDGTLTIDLRNGNIDGMVLLGTLSEDGQTISGELTDTYGTGKHWLKGPFTMTRE